MAENWRNHRTHSPPFALQFRLKSNSADLTYTEKMNIYPGTTIKNCVDLTLRERKVTMFA